MLCMYLAITSGDHLVSLALAPSSVWIRIEQHPIAVLGTFTLVCSPGFSVCPHPDVHTPESEPYGITLCLKLNAPIPCWRVDLHLSSAQLDSENHAHSRGTL